MMGFCAISARAQTHSDHDGHDHAKMPAVKPSGEDPIELNKISHDFGKIPQGKPVYSNFIVKNVGNKPIKLDNVQAACGCTTPEWSREEIAPGASTTIRVGYNAAAEGPFEKPVTIYYADRVKQFTVKGTVWRAPDGSAPKNVFIDKLKKKSN